MKMKFISLSIVVAFLLSCGSITHNEPKIYVSGMEPLMDQGTHAVLAEIEENTDKTHAYIGVVFRNDKLEHFHVWQD